jgi:hypothetical protein
MSLKVIKIVFVLSVGETGILLSVYNCLPLLKVYNVLRCLSSYRKNVKVMTFGDLQIESIICHYVTPFVLAKILFLWKNMDTVVRGR